MKRFPPSATTARLCAATLSLASVTALALAQTPLVPHAPTDPSLTHHHSRVAPPSPDTARPTILSGRSYVSPPRSGTHVAFDAFSAIFGHNSAVTLPPWVSVGPDSVQNAFGTVGGNADVISGRVAALAVDPTDNSIIYVASAGGGVWKTTDGGLSYVATTDFLGDTAMGSIAVAPSDSQTLYAGTGEASNSGDSKYGNGLLKSTDGAATWSLIPGPSGAFIRLAISKIVVSPTDPKVVYLTTADFAVNGLGGNTGVWKSTDGGGTWANTTALAGLDAFEPYSDLVMDPDHSNTLHAAIGDYGGSGSNGVYITTDGGGTWAKQSSFPTANVGRISLALAASASNTLYASVSSSSGSAFGSLLGLYKTTNDGANWTKLTAAPDYLGQQGWYDNAIAVSPTNPNQVFAGGQVNYNAADYTQLRALIGSQDGGATFQDYSIGVGFLGPHTDLHALTFTADGTALLDGNDGGVWRLENPSTQSTTTASGGSDVTQWTDINANLGTIQFTGIALHPTDTGTAYGGSQDNGTEKYTGSVAWSQVRGGDGGFVRVDQTTPQTVYHEYYRISLERSDDGGASWNGKTTGIHKTDTQPPDGSDPAAFYVPYKLDPANQSRVIYGTNHVYESVDKGENFAIIGTPGTAGFNPSGHALRTLGVNGQAVYAAVDGNVFATFNDGATWADVSLPGNVGRITDIFVNPANAQDVYAAHGAFGGGKVFHSTNGGTAWADISGNLPDEPFNAILQDPATGSLYAGGDDGVYTSPDGGSTWSRFDPAGNFPNVQVVDLALSPGTNTLGAGTHGRGLFEISLAVAAPTTTGLSSSVNPSAVGQSVTFTANVSGSSPTGTVTFTIDGAAQTPVTVGSGGIASLTTSALSAGLHPVTATYNGDASNAASTSSTLNQNVTGSTAATALAMRNATGSAGQTVNLYAALATTGGTALPGQTVTFSIDGTAVASGVTNNGGVRVTAYTLPAALALGGHALTAAFSGDANNASCSGAATLTVVLPATKVAVSGATGIVGQTVTLRASLHRVVGGAAVAGESVTFSVDGSAVGTGVTNASGLATLPYVLPAGDAAGTHPITASFGGDGSYAASSGTNNLAVKSTTALSVANVSGQRGTSVTLTAVLTAGGSASPGKTVTLKVDGKVVGTAVTDSAGTASLPYAVPAASKVGHHAVSASFAGDAGDAPAAGAGTLTVR